MTKKLQAKQLKSEIPAAFGLVMTSRHCERGKAERGNLTKTLLVLAFTIGLLFIFASTALAGGWHYIGDEDDPDAGQWLKSKSPHTGLQTSTNNCKTCHSVHDADIGSGQNSFKLLRDKSRITECNSCHDATSGLSSKRPYQIGEFKQVRGEHSLGSTIIPDSESSIISNGINKDGLSCGSCHSVHGARTMQNDLSKGKLADPEWEAKILKSDPAGNGGDASKATAYDGGDIPGGFVVNSTANDYAQSKTAFCADCHNDNSNWDSNSDDGRPNGRSHVQGPAADGLMMVGDLKTKVANFGKWDNNQEIKNKRTSWQLEQNTGRGCLSCHQAGSGGAGYPYDGASNSFPHQSTGSKFLMENYTVAEQGWVNERDARGIRQSNRGINKASRPLASLDKVCLDCHRNQRGLGSDSLGVGKHF